MQRTPQGPTPASHSSRTLTLSDAPPSSSSSDPQPAPANPLPTLRLRGRADPGARGVTWSDNTVDNEGLGRKKSKSASPPLSFLPPLPLPLCTD
mgnify:FL=1